MWETPEFKWAFNEVDGKVDKDLKDTVARMQAEASAEDSELSSSLRYHTVTGATGDLVAMAKTFVRTISHSGGVKKRILALGNVACHPSARGAGLGGAVVKAALRRLDEFDDVTHFLFETAIPPFYEKLGARQIEKSSVINSTGDNVAFEDEFVMVYPASEPWPAGTIDLLGPGY